MQKRNHAILLMAGLLVFVTAFGMTGTAEAAVVHTGTDSITLTDNGDGTKTLKYSFQVTQLFPATKKVCKNVQVWFVEDDSFTCDDNIGRTTVKVCLNPGQKTSAMVMTSITFNPVLFETDTEIEFHTEVHAMGGLAGTGEGLFDWPSESGSGDPPPGSEPDICDPNVVAYDFFPGATATISYVPGDVLIVHPYDLPDVTSAGTGHDRYEVSLEDFETGEIFLVGTMPSNGNIPNIEEINFGSMENMHLGAPSMGVFDISEVENFDIYDRVVVTAVDDDLEAPAIEVMESDVVGKDAADVLPVKPMPQPGN